MELRFAVKRTNLIENFWLEHYALHHRGLFCEGPKTVHYWMSSWNLYNNRTFSITLCITPSNAREPTALKFDWRGANDCHKCPVNGQCLGADPGYCQGVKLSQEGMTVEHQRSHVQSPLEVTFTKKTRWAVCWCGLRILWRVPAS